MNKLIITSVSTILFAVTSAMADTSSRYMASSDQGYTSTDFLAAAQPVDGRNNRVTDSQRLIAAIKKSAKKSGKCVVAKVNPGQSEAIFVTKIRSLYKGVIPKTKVKPTMIESRFMHKGELIRVCVKFDGRGHASIGGDMKLSSIHMTNTKSNWDKAAAELQRRLEALRNNA